MLKIYNTLTRKTEKFIPVNKNKVNLYVCGPTVYSLIHLGNARPIIFFDVVRRYLEVSGYNVIYASNITDVDDKIINKAKELNITEKELTNKYAKEYLKTVKLLGSEKPNIIPYATKYIKDMVKYIEDLIKLGYAYENAGNVYFRVNKIKSYGKLSNQSVDFLEEGARIKKTDNKENQKDFTLWKKTDIGVKYDSPWSKGRPGWHTECSVMNEKIFNTTIDIHGGGTDLEFPHHENERAQCLAHSNKELAKYWMHVGRLDLLNTKMSKSLGNIVWVKDIDNPIAFRLLILAHHYRAPINYSNKLLKEYESIFDKLSRSIRQAKIKLDLNKYKINDELERKYLILFKEKMDNDFDTPNVFPIIYELQKQLNKEDDLDKLIKLLNTILMILKILGIEIKLPNLTNNDIKDYNLWVKARENKDYELSDKLRAKLTKRGIL